MSDFERLLRDSLKQASEGYSPKDPTSAREQFLARRRRRRVRFVAAGAGFAGAVAAVAFFFAAPSTPLREAPRVRPGAGQDVARVTATVEVGTRPSGVAVGRGQVWVANVGEESVAQVDPGTNEVVARFDVRGGPDDVAVTEENVWITTDRGALWRLEPSAGELVQMLRPEIDGASGHLDIASDGQEVFVQVDSGRLVVLDDSGRSDEPYEIDGEPTDVAVHGNNVWVYERSAGTVVRFDRATGSRLGDTPVGDTNSQDLAADRDYAWFFRGSDATLVQISAADGSTVGEYPLVGSFGAISIAPDGVWVMTTVGGEGGTGDGYLYWVDPEATEEIGAPVSLDGLPYDVAAGAEGIWVTNHETGTVTRVDFVPADAPEQAGD